MGMTWISFSCHPSKASKKEVLVSYQQKWVNVKKYFVQLLKSIIMCLFKKKKKTFLIVTLFCVTNLWRTLGSYNEKKNWFGLRFEIVLQIFKQVCIVLKSLKIYFEK